MFKLEFIKYFVYYNGEYHTINGSLKFYDKDGIIID